MQRAHQSTWACHGSLSTSFDLICHKSQNSHSTVPVDQATPELQNWLENNKNSELIKFIPNRWQTKLEWITTTCLPDGSSRQSYVTGETRRNTCTGFKGTNRQNRHLKLEKMWFRTLGNWWSRVIAMSCERQYGGQQPAYYLCRRRIITKYKSDEAYISPETGHKNWMTMVRHDRNNVMGLNNEKLEMRQQQPPRQEWRATGTRKFQVEIHTKHGVNTGNKETGRIHDVWRTEISRLRFDFCWLKGQIHRI